MNRAELLNAAAAVKVAAAIAVLTTSTIADAQGFTGGLLKRLGEAAGGKILETADKSKASEETGKGQDPAGRQAASRSAQSARQQMGAPTVDLRKFFPKAIAGWTRDGEFNADGDHTRQADQGYTHVRGDGGVHIMIRRRSEIERMMGGSGKPKLGADRDIRTKVTSEVDVNGTMGYMTYDSEAQSGQLDIVFETLAIRVDGNQVNGGDLIAFARMLDIGALSKL